MTEIESGLRSKIAGLAAARAVARTLAVLASIALSGCSGGEPLESFDLSASAPTRGGRSARGQIVVGEPVATSPTDSDRIVVRPTPDSVATLKGAQWSERLPRLLQTRLVQSFENARLLRSVGRPDAKILADYTLASEIRRFEIDITRGQAIVEISVKLIAEGSGRIAAAQIFSAQAPGSAADGAGAAAALDQALGQAMREIVAWTAARI